MARLEYVGKKARREDTVAGTGVVWTGPGDVQEVPDEKLPLFLLHPDIWRVAAEFSKERAELLWSLGGGSIVAAPDVAPGATLANAPVAEPAKPAEPAGTFVLEHADGPVVLDTMDDAALKAFVKAHKPIDKLIDLRKTKGGDALRAAIVDAVVKLGG